MKAKSNLEIESKSLPDLKWILFVFIAFAICNSNAQTKVVHPTKKNASKASAKPKSAKSNLARFNKTKPLLEKIEVPQSDNATSTLKVVPRPKIPNGQLAIFKDGRYILITTKKVDNLEISANCFEAKRPTCTALEIGQTKVTSLESPTGQISNPASTLCDQLLGKNYIAINSKGSEFDYCGFNDGTFVDTWTLLSKVMHK